MELSKKQIKSTKGVAILFMLLLHLFCTKDYQELFKPLFKIGQVPFIYYFALFADCCVAIYCFCSGYGLYLSWQKDKANYKMNNHKRILKLYINVWIIFVIFVALFGALTGKFSFEKGGLLNLILNLLLIKTDYNGAWWFLTTYIIMVVLSGTYFKLQEKYDWKSVVILSLGIYFVGYIIRMKVENPFTNPTLGWIYRQLGLWGTSQFPFVIGSLFAKYNVYSWLYDKLNAKRYKNLFLLLVLALMIIAHGIVQSLFVAAFNGIVFICIFNLLDKPKWLDEVNLFFGRHSTNIWLIHMFLYMTYLKSVVFAPKYPLLIYAWLIILCLGCSVVINMIYSPIKNAIDRRDNRNNKNIKKSK